jgi:hypothetical protein
MSVPPKSKLAPGSLTFTGTSRSSGLAARPGTDRISAPVLGSPRRDESRIAWWSMNALSTSGWHAPSAPGKARVSGLVPLFIKIGIGDH